MVTMEMRPIGTELAIRFFHSVPDSDSDDFVRLVDQLQYQPQIVILSFYNVKSCDDEAQALSIRDVILQARRQGSYVLQFIYGTVCSLGYMIADSQDVVQMSDAQRIQVDEQILCNQSRLKNANDIRCKQYIDTRTAFELGLADRVPEHAASNDTELPKDIQNRLREIFGYDSEEEEE